jgi:hypothetical protein
MEIQSEHAGGSRALPRILPRRQPPVPDFRCGFARLNPCSVPLRAIPCTKSKTAIATRNNRGFGDG